MGTLVPGEHHQIPALANLGETKRLRVLYVDTTRFFGPLMQVHSQVMRTWTRSGTMFTCSPTRSPARQSASESFLTWASGYIHFH
jgi:hypothetical protein